MYGLDLFYTRVTPSKMFDVLKEDFDYIFISGVLSALILVSFLCSKLASMKNLKMAWTWIHLHCDSTWNNKIYLWRKNYFSLNLTIFLFGDTFGVAFSFTTINLSCRKKVKPIIKTSTWIRVFKNNNGAMLANEKLFHLCISQKISLLKRKMVIENT